VQSNFLILSDSSKTMTHSDIPLEMPNWPCCYRLVPAQYPPVSVFDSVCDPEDLSFVFEIEALTNDRLRQELGALNLVAEEDRLSGPGTTPIMAAFTHIHPDGSRFTDGSFGAYYAAKTVDTAIAETKYHRERFLAATKQAPMEVSQRCYISRVIQPLRDVRGEGFDHLHDPQSYAASQHFGRTSRLAGDWGIWFRSVRDEAGECVAVFKPAALTPVKQGAHYTYVWDGETITWVYEKTGAKSF